MNKLKVLDLFSGIGGFSLGLERTGGFETVAFCEIEPFCQKVLKKHWPGVRIYDDVRSIDGKGLGTIDLVTGGFPCQPASTAGKRLGTADDRWLWSEIIRIVQIAKPEWCIFENVRGLLSLEGGLVFEQCALDLEAEGYEVQAFIVPACAVGAPHRRDRVWIVAHAASQRCRKKRGPGARPTQRLTRTSSKSLNVPDCSSKQCNERQFVERRKETEKGRLRKQAGTSCETLANSSKQRRSRQGKSVKPFDSTAFGEGETIELINGGFARKWPVEPQLGRVANGIPRRVDRLRGLGNAVVPQIPELIGNAILDSEGVQ